MNYGTSGVGPRIPNTQIQHAAPPKRPLPPIPGQSLETTAKTNAIGQEAVSHYIALPETQPFTAVQEKKDFREMSLQERNELRDEGVDLPSEQEIQTMDPPGQYIHLPEGQQKPRSQSLPPERQATPQRERSNTWHAESEKYQWGKADTHVNRPAIKAPDSEGPPRAQPEAVKTSPPGSPPLGPSGYPILPRGPQAATSKPPLNPSEGQYDVMPHLEDEPIDNPSEGQYGVMPHFEDNPVAEEVNHLATLEAIQRRTDPSQKTVQLIALKDQVSAEAKSSGQDSESFKSLLQEIDKQLAQENAKLTGAANPAPPAAATRPRSRTSVNYRMSHLYKRTRSASAPAVMQTAPSVAQTPLQAMSRSELARHAEKLQEFDKETAEALEAKIMKIKSLEANQSTLQTKINHGIERTKNRGTTDLERLEAALKKLENKEWDSDLNVPRKGSSSPQPVPQQAAAPPPPPSLDTPLPPPPPPPRYAPPPKL